MCALFFFPLFSRQIAKKSPQKRRNIEALETGLCTGEEGRGGGAAAICLHVNIRVPHLDAAKIRLRLSVFVYPQLPHRLDLLARLCPPAHSPSLPLYPSALLPTVLASSYPSEFALPVSPSPPPTPTPHCVFFSLCHSSPLNPQLLSHAGPGDTCGDCVLNGFFIRFIKGKAAA